MSTELIEAKIVACFEGELTTTERSQLIDQVSANEAYQQLWREYEEMYELISGDIYELPESNLTQEYDGWLDGQAKDTVSTETKDSKNQLKKLVWFLGLCLLALLGYNLSSVFKTEQPQMQFAQSTFQNDLLGDSPSDRIKAIRVNYNQVEENQEVFNLLCRVLRNDQSSNVRLAAAESLGKYVYNENVRIELIRALENENDGFVKLAIINALGTRVDAEVKKTLEDLVSDETQQKFVKDEAYSKLIQY